MARRCLFPSFLLLLTALSGCSGTGTVCDGIAITTSIVSVDGTDITVDGGDLILHAAGAGIYQRDDGCRRITAADLAPGQRLGHDATEIAESYPMQAWPDTVVVRPA